MSETPFKLHSQIKLKKGLIELWHRYPYQGKVWHLADYELRLNGNVIAEFPRQSILANARNAFEKIAGLKFAGYPPPDTGTPKWLHKRSGVLYWAPFKEIAGPNIFTPVV